MDHDRSGVSGSCLKKSVDFLLRPRCSTTQQRRPTQLTLKISMGATAQPAQKRAFFLTLALPNCLYENKLSSAGRPLRRPCMRKVSPVSLCSYNTHGALYVPGRGVCW